MSLTAYRRRFKGLGLWRYRRTMRPEVFAVFMAFMGVVEAPPGFDVVAACRPYA